ncbi:MAG: GTP 3',8-cyclase MoaA [bacterium]
MKSTPRAELPVIDPALTDRSRRKIKYLRVSVTDRCNYRCAYCMPAEGFVPTARAAVLTLEEIATFVRLMAELGVERVRLTGGEPLIRRDLVRLVGWIAETPGIREVAMTTNGHLLDRHAAALHAAGLRVLNVSVDTFDRDRFAAITRGGDLDRVVAGLRAATAAGFERIRVNVVAIRGVNDGELAAIAHRCWAEGWLPRFIELMPIGGLGFQAEERRIETPAILAELGATLPLRHVGRPGGDLPRGPAEYWVVTEGPAAGRELGIISPMSDDGFCAACNRARLTARGGLRACLADDREVSILQNLRAGAPREVLIAQIREAVEGKRPAHLMGSPATIPLAVMTGLGG